MKKLNLYLWVALAGVAMFFSACEKDDEQKKEVKISFENVALNEDGYQNDFPDGLILSDIDFYNHYENDPYTYWEGFAVSKNTDKITSGYANEFSVYASSGANGSEKFAIAYAGFNETTNCKFAANREFRFKSLMINNTTLTALALKEGLFAARAFEENDWLKIVITGFDAKGNETGKIEFYLADFRGGKSYICQEWTNVDLKNLGKANKLEFIFESTDNDPLYGMNTPSYACIDDIIYYAE